MISTLWKIKVKRFYRWLSLIRDPYKSHFVADCIHYKFFIHNSIYNYSCIGSISNKCVYIYRTSWSLTTKSVYLPFYYKDVPLVYRNKL